MGMTLVEKLNKIFAKRTNFDISGMCDPELVTVELARELADAYTSPGGWHNLAKAGYDIHRFSGYKADSGIVGKWVEYGKSHEHLKLYYDQDFPAKIEREKEALRNGLLRPGNAESGKGAEPDPEADRG